MILLTGTSGFIGQHLLKTLIRVNGSSEVLALTSEPINQCPFILHDNYHFNNDVFIKSGLGPIDTIIHAGAFTPKNSSQANDWKLSNSNITSTAALLSALFPKLRKIIYLSTLDVYEVSEIITEDSNLSPASLYAYSKLYCERMVEAWGFSNGTNVQILRIGHVYGPGEEAYQKIIPATLKKILNSQPVEIWGSGDEFRTFIYIDDVIHAIINAIMLDDYFGIINVVGEQKIRIKDLINKIIQISGQKVVINTIQSDAAKKDYIFNNDKMKKLLWPSEIPLEQGLKNEWLYMQSVNHADTL